MDDEERIAVAWLKARFKSGQFRFWFSALHTVLSNRAVDRGIIAGMPRRLVADALIAPVGGEGRLHCAREYEVLPAVLKIAAPPVEPVPVDITDDHQGEYTRWLESPGMIEILKANNIGTSDRTIARYKGEWLAEAQPGSNNRRFRFSVETLKSRGLTIPPALLPAK